MPPLQRGKLLTMLTATGSTRLAKRTRTRASIPLLRIVQLPPLVDLLLQEEPLLQLTRRGQQCLPPCPYLLRRIRHPALRPPPPLLPAKSTSRLMAETRRKRLTNVDAPVLRPVIVGVVTAIEMPVPVLPRAVPYRWSRRCLAEQDVNVDESMKND